MSLEDKDKKILTHCHPNLEKLFQRVALRYPLKIIEGYRTKEEQAKMFEEKKSKVEWPNSKHNSYPSKAVDVAPTPIDWTDTEKFYHFAGFVQAIALEMGIEIRWGGDWDQDLNLKEERFLDLVHFELVE